MFLANEKIVSLESRIADLENENRLLKTIDINKVLAEHINERTKEDS